MLPTRPLGKTGIPVTILGFGGVPVGDLYERLDEGRAIATVESAHRAGMTLFDTSPHYGNGLSELRFGAALRRFPRDSYVLSTKVGRRMDPRKPGRSVGGPGFAGGVPHASIVDYSYDGTMRSFEQSLLRLGLDRIDILLLHDVDVWTHGPEMADQRFREAMEGSYKAVHELRSQGVVKAVGLGLNESDTTVRFVKAGDFDCVLLAGRYSLLHQDALDEFLPLAEQKGIGVILGGIYNSGILATGAKPGAHFNYVPAPPEVMDKVARIERVCEAHGVPIAVAALRFALGAPAVASVILGGASPEEVERNMKAIKTEVPAALWRDLKTERLLPESVPVPA
ncbi:aldo/keto reductase [Microvirga yunnanensis]|uniref:aldo/keto reductase n=1 Tax=Microvirga yunnanensis TaxID=2953740 RepID=UPI0021C5E39F|nr:aldo/keto reductase [Microvirga sp. HBU65207]